MESSVESRGETVKITANASIRGRFSAQTVLQSRNCKIDGDTLNLNFLGRIVLNRCKIGGHGKRACYA